MTWALALQVATALGGDTAKPAPVPPSYSLAPWAERVWNRLADREGAIFGRLAEEGIFQRYHPLQDHEYRLDEFTGAFALRDQGAWRDRRNVIRGWGASVSNRDLINAVEARVSLPVARRVGVGFHLWQEETLEARRQRLLFGLRVDSLVGPWAVSFRTSVELVKPDADLEFDFERTFGERLAVSLGVAVLDAFNDFSFVTLGIDSAETDFFREYFSQPVAARYAIEWRPARGWRLEARGGTTNRAHLKGDLVLDDLRGFGQRERVWFTGVLAEWSPRPDLAIGAFGRTADAKVEREYESSDSSSNFELSERTTTAALYGLLRVGTEWDVEGAVLYTERPEDRRGFGAVVLDDREWSVWVSLWRKLAGWAYLSLGYFYDDRALRGDPALADALAARNQRLRTDIEVRFPAGAKLGAGVNWDLDFPTDQSFFDGAHGRLVLPF